MISHSPSVVHDGLVFAYDMANTKKSWKGAVTTNLSINNTFYSNWANSGTGVWDANDAIINRLYTDYPLLSLLVTSTGNLHISCGRASISAGATYTVSVYIYIPSSAGVLSGTVPYIRTDPANTGRGNLSYNGNADWVTWPRDVWIRITQTFTNTANDTAVYISCYLNTLNNKIYMTAPTVENIGFMTPFVGGAGATRSNTQAIVDLTGNHTVTASSLTYVSDGTFSFASPSNFASVAYNAALDLVNTVTLEAWLKYTTSTNTVVIEKSNSNTHYQFQIFNSGQGAGIGGDIVFMLRPNSSNWVTAGLALNNGQWHHVVGTYDRSTTTARIYVDGILRNTNGAIATGPTTNTQPLLIGSRSGGSGFGGTIPVAKVYNRVLSAAEVQQNFNATRSRYGL